jgi:hypothetical protein
LLRNRGRMRVGGEERMVAEVDVIIPPDMSHGIENVSAATPPAIGRLSITGPCCGPGVEEKEAE